MSDLYSLIGAAFEEQPPRFATPGDLAIHQNPLTIQTPALDLIDAALVDAYRTPDSRLIINMPPQEGKTERAGRDFPLWCLTQNPELRVIVASYGLTLAQDTGRAIRNRIARGDLGLSVAKDQGSVQKWTLQGHGGGVRSVGFTSGVAGHPADLLIIDDPIKSRADAESVTWRERIWNAWTADFGARLAPGAPVIVMMTRWHEDDLAGRLVTRNPEAGWKVLSIPAQADHNPAKGETDALGRQPGEFMVSTRGRTTRQWELRKAQAGSRDWTAQYQGRPSSAEGGMFKRAWWTGTDGASRMYTTPLHVKNPDGSCMVPGDGTLIQSWDMTFKGTSQSDYVVGQVWLKRGAHAYLLDQYRAQATFTETKAAVQRMTAKWPQASTKLIEEKANGAAVIDELKGSVGGMIAVNPRGSKEARASAVTPYVESGSVHLPLNGAFTDALVEEHAAFPNGAHDDQVDALTQALDRLYLNGMAGNAWLEWAEKQIAERDGGTGV